MDSKRSKRLKLAGASALAFILATSTSFWLLTSNSDAKAKSKRTQTTLMAKQQTPETSQPPSKQTKKKGDGREKSQPTAETQAQPQPQPKPKSLKERLAEDLQRAREADKQQKDVEAFRTACSVANTIKRNKLDQSGADAETFRKYSQEAVEIAQASGDRLQKKNNNHDKPLVFIF